jgi:hypothetical protein
MMHVIHVWIRSRHHDLHTFVLFPIYLRVVSKSKVNGLVGRVLHIQPARPGWVPARDSSANRYDRRALRPSAPLAATQKNSLSC